MNAHIRDNPEDQGIKSRPVRWCEVVCKARWFVEEGIAA